MIEALIKEIRVGITASRSGMNLQTKFKKKVRNLIKIKNEQINTILAKYLDYLEERSLNRIDERYKIINKIVCLN